MSFLGFLFFFEAFLFYFHFWEVDDGEVWSGFWRESFFFQGAFCWLSSPEAMLSILLSVAVLLNWVVLLDLFRSTGVDDDRSRNWKTHPEFGCSGDGKRARTIRPQPVSDAGAFFSGRLFSPAAANRHHLPHHTIRKPQTPGRASPKEAQAQGYILVLKTPSPREIRASAAPPTLH